MRVESDFGNAGSRNAMNYKLFPMESPEKESNGFSGSVPLSTILANIKQDEENGMFGNLECGDFDDLDLNSLEQFIQDPTEDPLFIDPDINLHNAGTIHHNPGFSLKPNSISEFEIIDSDSEDSNPQDSSDVHTLDDSSNGSINIIPSSSNSLLRRDTIYRQNIRNSKQINFKILQPRWNGRSKSKKSIPREKDKNLKEKLRRDGLRNNFDNLRRHIPGIKNENKCPHVKIINKAVEYIQFLTKLVTLKSKLLDLEKQKNSFYKSKLKKLRHKQMKSLHASH